MLESVQQILAAQYEELEGRIKGAERNRASEADREEILRLKQSKQTEIDDVTVLKEGIVLAGLVCSFLVTNFTDSFSLLPLFSLSLLPFLIYST